MFGKRAEAGLWELGLKNQIQAALQGLDVRFAARR